MNTWRRSGTRVVEGHLEEKEEEDGRAEPDQGHSSRMTRRNSSPSHEGRDLLTSPEWVSMKLKETEESKKWQSFHRVATHEWALICDSVGSVPPWDLGRTIADYVFSTVSHSQLHHRILHLHFHFAPMPGRTRVLYKLSTSTLFSWDYMSSSQIDEWMMYM